MSFGRSKKNTTALALSVIDYSLRESVFNEQVCSALRSKGAFILSDVPRFTSTTNQLYHTYDHFLRQDGNVKKTFECGADLTKRTGFMPYGSFFAGSRACDRFLINHDRAGMTSQALPKPSQSNMTSMEEASYQYLLLTKEMVTRTVKAVEVGFNLDGQLSKLFVDHETVTSMDSYLPITQEKLLDWVENKKLTKTEDGRIESFASHADLVPLSVLTYRNNLTQGLELKLQNESGAMSFKQLQLQEEDPYNIQAVVMVGKVMEMITDKKFTGVEHRVVARPLQQGQLFQRCTINYFTILNSHWLPTLMKDFFVNEATKLNKVAESRAVTHLTAEELARYPKEADIEIEDTQSGIMYRRR